MRYRNSGNFRLNPIHLILAMNLLLFIARLVIPELILFLGLAPRYFLNQPWTIVTSLFMHASFWHIIANMFTLYFFGTALSRLIAYKWMLMVYFGGGILGSIFFILLGSPFAVVVGASGAVFAMGGALAVMRPQIKVYIFPIPVAMPLWVAILLGMVILGFLPFVAWQAHLGGLIFGLIAGYIFRRRERRLFRSGYVER